MKKIVLVGSGKGGVGKSTVSVNLSIALGALGLNVGLLDADIFGPSIPIMMGLRRLNPRSIKNSEGKESILPFAKFGIRTMSMGFFLHEAEAGVWRGPLISNLLHKLLFDVDWGDLDLLIIDLPPGTGDIPITLKQLIPIDGAIIVTTPQEVALLDAMKAVNAFDQLQIPLLGVIENMSSFTTSDTTYSLFGKSRGASIAQKFSTPHLGSIPFFPTLMENSDEGLPPAFISGPIQTLFHQIANHVERIIV